MKRRNFLKTAPALAATGLVASSSRAAGAERVFVSSFDPWVEIEPRHLAGNVAQISSRVSGRPILAVIKNNGYGMGVVNVARLLEPEPAIHGFAVVKLQEAVVLREAGIRKPVLLMGPFDATDLYEAATRDIMPMVYQPMGPWLDRIAERTERPASIHVCVDTGMGRVGVPYEEAAPLIRDLASRDSVKLEGTMMTFVEDEFDDEQMRRFRALTDGLKAEGVGLGRLHAASSFGLFQHPDYFLDMVRPGMAIYGVYSAQEFRGSEALSLEPALALKARVIYVKKLEAGETAGYERAYRAEQPVWIATVPVGHTDGLPREAANAAKVRIGEKLYPIVASVSASHCIVEIGAEKTVEIGDEVAIFDWRKGSRPEDVSADCGASVYDLTMHLNPLLPRRIV